MNLENETLKEYQAETGANEKQHDGPLASEGYISGSSAYPVFHNGAVATQTDQAKPENFIRHPWMLLLVALVLALGTDLLVYGQSLGKQFAIVVNALMIGMLILSWTEKRRVPWQSWPLIAMISVSSVLTVFRAEPFTITALVIFVVLGLSLLLVTLLSGQWALYRLREYVKQYFLLGIHGFIGLPRTLVDFGKNVKHDQGAKRHLQVIGAVLLGLLLAIPLLLLFGNLLSSADSHFASQIKGFLDFFKFEKVENFWPHFFIVFVLFWGFAGVLYYMLRQSRLMEDIEPDKALIPPFLVNIAALVALGLVNLLFLVFIVGQWGYFFGGAANINADGFTYSSYATSGFRELMIAASIAAVVHYLFSSVTKRETRAQKVSFSVVATLLLVLVGLMLVSAFQRLLLYEAAYGFTRDRLVAHVFMVFLALVLAALAVMEITKSLKHMAVVLLVTCFLFGVTLSAVNVDRTITRLNITQATLFDGYKRSSSRFDGSYLAISVGKDSIPELYRNYTNPETHKDLREDLGKTLACRALRLENDEPLGKWHTYNVPAKAEYDFFAAQGENLLKAFPPEKDDCNLGYTIHGEYVYCTYVCGR